MAKKATGPYWPAEVTLCPVAPVVRSGHFVFASTFYSIDAQGRVVEVANHLSRCESTTSRQTRYVFGRLEDALESGGSSLSHAVHCDVQTADELDFYEFDLIWKQRFGAVPPARLAFVVGHNLVPPGALIGIHTVGLAAICVQNANCRPVPPSAH